MQNGALLKHYPDRSPLNTVISDELGACLSKTNPTVMAFLPVIERKYVLLAALDLTLYVASIFPPI